MKILGLTGSIAVGKSMVAECCRRQHIPVFDADQEVHKLYAKGGKAVKPIAALIPEAVRAGQVDRQVLADKVLENPALLKQLEAIVHPLVREAETRFIQRWRHYRKPLVVLEIPLLFEAGNTKCDEVMVVTAPRFLQQRWALRRPGMTVEKLERFRKLQLPEHEKCKRADYVIRNGQNRGTVYRQVKRVIQQSLFRASR